MISLNIKDLVPRKDSPYYQGYYKLINHNKYIGDPNKIILRSSYEKKFATYCDINDRILKWSSEPIPIKYFHPIHKKIKPYNVDFYVRVDIGNNKYNEYIVEVKPARQLKQPTPPTGRITEKKMKAYYNYLKTYAINTAKFTAAKKYAEERGWNFVIVTESYLF